jgi:hypothetical protein
VLSPNENTILTFTENDLIYTLSKQEFDGTETVLLEAKETGDGFIFKDKIGKELDYSDMDYLRLFLNLIQKLDENIFESYILTEAIAIL